MNPECKAGKHHNCDGKAWRDDLDDIGPCQCECHQTRERIKTPEAAERLPVGSIIVDITEPDAPAIACKAARGDWAFLGDEPLRRFWSSEILPANGCRIVLLWNPNWAIP